MNFLHNKYNVYYNYYKFPGYGNTISYIRIPVPRIVPYPWIYFEGYISNFQLPGNLETHVEFRCFLYNLIDFCIQKHNIFHSV